MGNVVVCPLYDSQFDVTMGLKIYGPAHGPVKVESNDVLVDM